MLVLLQLYKNKKMSNIEVLPMAVAETSPPVDELEVTRRRAIEHVPSTGRGVKDYEELLGIKPESLRDKKILDIGAGFANFARESKHFGAETVSLEPQDPTDRLSMTPEEKAEFKRAFSRGEIVQGIVQSLPFQDGSFDRVFAVVSIPYYLPRQESERALAFDEMVRVLKPGGEVRIYPVELSGKYPWSVSDGIIKRLQSEGYKVEFENGTQSSPRDPVNYRMIVRKPGAVELDPYDEAAWFPDAEEKLNGILNKL